MSSKKLTKPESVACGSGRPGSELTRPTGVLALFLALAIMIASMIATPAGAQTLTGMSGYSPPPAAQGGAAMDSGQNPFLGSSPSGQASSHPIPLTLKEAISRGLKYNLGLLLQEQGTRAAQGQRYQALAELLPNVKVRTSETVEQVDLAAFGFTGIPGFNVPNVIGPFSVFDVRAIASIPVLDFSARNRLKAASENIKAANYSYKDAKDLVVLVVSGNYLLAFADSARVGTAEAQLKTAQALSDRATDLLKAGLTPAIDQMRAQVELQGRRQQLIVARNNLQIQKLNLSRAIGLPQGQTFELAEQIPYKPLPAVNAEDALAKAYSQRADYQIALSQVRSAQLTLKAARAERLPTVGINADYGDIGLRPTSSHGTETVAGALTIPIFQGGRVRGEVMQAEAALRQRESQLNDVRGRIDYDIRAALMNLQAAGEQVEVARSEVDLAQQTLTQAQDRFGAGVTDNIEVIQAQESVVQANEAYISSLYAHNLAKVSLARAMGMAEQSISQYLGGK